MNIEPKRINRLEEKAGISHWPEPPNKQSTSIQNNLMHNIITLSGALVSAASAGYAVKCTQCAAYEGPGADLGKAILLPHRSELDIFHIIITGWKCFRNLGSDSYPMREAALATALGLTKVLSQMMRFGQRITRFWLRILRFCRRFAIFWQRCSRCSYATMELWQKLGFGGLLVPNLSEYHYYGTH